MGHAFIEAPGGQIEEAELRDFLKSRLANYKISKVFSFKPALPKLPNMKIDKQALKRRLEREAA